MEAFLLSKSRPLDLQSEEIGGTNSPKGSPLLLLLHVSQTLVTYLTKVVYLECILCPPADVTTAPSKSHSPSYQAGSLWGMCYMIWPEDLMITCPLPHLLCCGTLHLGYYANSIVIELHLVDLWILVLDEALGIEKEKSYPEYSLTSLRTNYCPSRVKGPQCNQYTTKWWLLSLRDGVRVGAQDLTLLQEGWTLSNSTFISALIRESPRYQLMHSFHPYHQGTHLWAHCTCIAVSDDRGWLTWTVRDYLSLYLFSVSPMVDAHWWAYTWLTKITLCAHFPMSIHMASCSQSFNIIHSRPLTS